jgi:mannosyltransferase OCH1-like enzyme
LAIKPGNAVIRSALMHALIRSGDDVEAEELLSDALAETPNDLSLLIARIDLLAGRGALAEALEASAIVLAHPEATGGWHRLRHVGLLRQLGRQQEALEVLDGFEAGDDETLAAHGLQARGVVLRELGRLPESLDHLRQAVERDPSCPDHAVALASLLAEIGAFEEGLDMLQEAERRVGEVSGLTSQPWLQMARVILYRGIGDRESALAIAEGLVHDTRVGFHARVQRAELLMIGADPRAGDAIDSLLPVTADQLRQERLSRSEWLRSQYRFEEALEPLAPLLDTEPLDLLAAERACLLRTLVMDLQEAQKLFFRIRSAKQTSANPRLKETAFHGLHRCLIEEFNTNRLATERIRALAAEPPASRLAPLAELLRREPHCSAAAMGLLIAARQAGRLEAWSTSPSAEPGSPQIPREVVQYWDASSVPDGVRSLMQSWPEANPSFGHHVVDQATAHAFLELHSTSLVQEAFAAALSPVIQSDLFRLAWLHLRGGVYADADDRCRHSLEPLLSGGVRLLLLQEDIGSIGNNLIAAAPRHPFLADVLEVAARNVLEEQASNPWFLTGPGVLTQVFVRRYGQVLTDPQAPRPPGLRLLTQYELNRRVSMHLQTPVKVNEGSWAAPRGRRTLANRLIVRRPTHDS